MDIEKIISDSEELLFNKNMTPTDDLKFIKSDNVGYQILINKKVHGSEVNSLNVPLTVNELSAFNKKFNTDHEKVSYVITPFDADASFHVITFYL